MCGRRDYYINRRYHGKSFFEVNRPLLSRLRLITLETLTPDAIVKVLQRALTDEDKGLGKQQLKAEESVLREVGMFVNGDARMALNILEQAAAMVENGGELTLEILERVVGRRIYSYDKRVITTMIRFPLLLKVCVVPTRRQRYIIWRA